VKILFLTPQLPYPPRQGTALRNFHLIEALASRQAVSVLTFLEPDQPADPSKWGPLPELCHGVVPVPIPPRSHARRLRDLLLTRQPDMALRLWSEAFADQLADWLKSEHFDVVQIEGIELAAYLPLVEQTAPGALVVFDDHNAEYVLQRRAFETDLGLPRRWHAAAYSFLQWRRLRRFEATTCRRAGQVIAVSGADRAALERLVPGLQVEVIPNCIDTAAYRQPYGGPKVPAFTVLFTGKMDFRPNVDAALWFGQDVWPLVRAGHPGATWGIVGKAPHPRLDVLRDDPSITLVGEVPEMRPYLAAAELYVIPLRMGGGTRFKLLEAMAAGSPIVSTTVGAEGVPVQTGQELLVADSAADFAAAVLRLLHDPSLGRQLSTAARKLVTERFDWRVVLGDLEQIYRL
jgi:glycosyltransferase involved in cell wall biosynthesis